MAAEYDEYDTIRDCTSIFQAAFYQHLSKYRDSSRLDMGCEWTTSDYQKGHSTREYLVGDLVENLENL